MRKFSLALSLSSILAGWCSVVYAEAVGPKVELHGFGSWAYGRTNENFFESGTPGGNWRNANLSLNATATLTDRLTVVSQVFFSETRDETNVELDFAFAEWRFDDALRFRAGKIKLPFGLYSEIFDVGTLRPFLALPQGIYGPIGFMGEAYHGIGFTGTYPFGNEWEIFYDLYGGGIVEEEFHAPEEFFTPGSALTGDGFEEETTKDVVGGRLRLETPMEGLSLGVSGLQGVEDSRRRWVVNPFVEYLGGGWSIRSEFAHETISDDLKANGFYAELAYWFTEHWQGALQYDRLTTELIGINTSSAPSLRDHNEVAAGLNYWFTSAFVLKTSYHYIRGNRFATPEPADLSASVSSGSLKKNTHLVQFGAQFSF